MKEVVIISGKGGTGKTSIVSALAGLGPKKVLADCDVDAADLHLILNPEVRETMQFISGELPEIDKDLCIECGECLEHCKFGAISEDFQVIKENCEGCGVCAFVCPTEAARMYPRHCGEWYISDTRFGTMVHASLGIGEENSGVLVTTVRKKAGALAEEQGVNLVLVDGSPGVGCPVIASLTNADAAIVVAEPTVSAEHDLHRVCELTEHFGIQTMAVINKSDINEHISGTIENYCQERKIPVLGRLPYDSRFTQAQIKKQNVLEFDPKGLGVKMESIWEKMRQELEL
jgi:MinD superfamily P-loop ATPase